MTREVPQVVTVRADDDTAHYAASTALDEVLGWFQDDGYTYDDLLELCESRIDTLYTDN